MLPDKSFISSADELITSHEETRNGFIKAAMEKNRKAAPIIEAAKTLKSAVKGIKTSEELLQKKSVYPHLLTAAGLSEKALKYFNEEDKEKAIKELIDNFLKPCGTHFIDELIYRFLLIKGDALGGSMRNYVGTIAEMRLKRQLLASLDFQTLPYFSLYKKGKSKNNWDEGTYAYDYERAEDITAIAWEREGKHRLIFFNYTIPKIGNNVDICLYSGTPADFRGGKIVSEPERAIMYGELKGGIDPAGADEHWKTGNSALSRIREAYKELLRPIKTSFIAAAIERNMAVEIWEQLCDDTLWYAANLTVEEQLCGYCDCVLKL